MIRGWRIYQGGGGAGSADLFYKSAALPLGEQTTADTKQPAHKPSRDVAAKRKLYVLPGRVERHGRGRGCPGLHDIRFRQRRTLYRLAYEYGGHVRSLQRRAGSLLGVLESSTRPAR